MHWQLEQCETGKMRWKIKAPTKSFELDSPGQRTCAYSYSPGHIAGMVFKALTTATATSLSAEVLYWMV